MNGGLKDDRDREFALTMTLVSIVVIGSCLLYLLAAGLAKHKEVPRGKADGSNVAEVR